MSKFYLLFLLLIYSFNGVSQILPLPPRPANAPSGSAFIQMIWSLTREEREEVIYSQVISGNVPDFMRQLVPVNTIVNINGTIHTATYFTVCDYFAVGSDNDYFLTPMTPLLAQRIANTLNCTLPTKRMVDTIYKNAPCKLRPQPIPPTPQMITVPVFAQHNDSVKSIRLPVINQYPLGTLVGGDKKDVIISNKIYYNLNPNVPKPVVIYGWHQLNGTPIQPVYNGHEETYADYSHGIRFIKDTMIVDGIPKKISTVLADSNLCSIISDEGVILTPRYNLAGVTTPVPKTFGILRKNNTSIKVVVASLAGTTYKAYYGLNGTTFNDSTQLFSDSLVVNGLLSDTCYYFFLRAFDSRGMSSPSEVLAAVTNNSSSSVLIVNGFDRATTTNTKNFIRQHASTFRLMKWIYDSATNEAVVTGLVSINNYLLADYILGDESTADETFSSTEQDTIKNFLRNGGRLFVSGSEIAWDLDLKGTTTDKEFITQFLKTQYVNDSPAGAVGVYYGVSPKPGTRYESMNPFNFDNGNYGTYNVKYPDVIKGVNGGANQLYYTGFSSDTCAAVLYKGIFPGGTKEGMVLLLGFPFETIYDASKRYELIYKTGFFSASGFSSDESSISEYRLYQNFPNPFNPQTQIQYSLKEKQFVTIKVVDILGKEVSVLVNEEKPAGKYSIEFNSKDLSSGIYFYQLVVDNFTQTKKMILLK